MGERKRPPTLLVVVVVVVVLGCALALGVAPSAQAANIVPNPGFEMNCSGIPCNWSVVPNTAVTIAYDTVNPHPPSTASMKVTVAQATSAGPISDCVPVALAAGTYSASFSYRTTGTLTHVPGLATFGYTNSSCSAGPFSMGNVNASSTINDGAWHSVSGTTTSPFAAQSVQFQVFFACVCSQVTTATVNFDDVDFESSPLAVTVYGLGAVRSHRAAVLRWRTGTEVNELGFNVYRQVGMRRVRVNRRLLPAFGRLAGASYSFVDRHAPQRAVRYWLQDVDVRGERTWHGPVRVAAA